jgi:two-component system, NarL family, nitrate/nitrite response regulator NarL
MQVKEALTERELELVKLAALGMRNRHIGWRLGISEDWVRHQFITIFDKTGAWSRLELVMKWVEEQERRRAGPPTPLPRSSSPASSSRRP